jgi:hypothetical protein
MMTRIRITKSSLHTGKTYSALLCIYRVVILLLRQRRGAAGNDSGTTIKYLRQTTSGAASIGIGTTAKYLRRTTSVAAGSSLGNTPNCLRGAAGNGQVQGSSTCDAQRALPRVTARAPRQMNTDLRRTTSAAASSGPTQRQINKSLRRTTSGAAGSGLCSTIKNLRLGLGSTIKYLRRTINAAAGNGLGTTIKYLVNQNAGTGSN